MQENEHSKEAMPTDRDRGNGNVSMYMRPRREHVEGACETREDARSYLEQVEGTLMDNEGEMVVNGKGVGHHIHNVGTEEDTKMRSGRQLKTMVNRLAPSPGFVDKNSLPADLMNPRRVRRVASINARAKVNVLFEPSSPLAGRSITDIMTHSKKVQGEDECHEFSDEAYSVKQRGRPRLASISTNDSNFLRRPELLSEAAHEFIENTHYRPDSENSTNSTSLKRAHDGGELELGGAKMMKFEAGFMRRNFEQNGDYSNTIITERRFVKGKEVVDVGLQVKIPKLRLGNGLEPSIQCTCRSSTLVDIPVKSYVSTYANGTLVSIPITKTHRLTPHVPEKPLPELTQGDLANRSKRVAGLNSRAMLQAILSEERPKPPVQDASKTAKKLQQKKSYYEHGLSNTVPSKLKIPKINFAATSTSNFGGRKMLGNQKTPCSTWSKSNLASHDGPKVAFDILDVILNVLEILFSCVQRLRDLEYGENGRKELTENGNIDKYIIFSIEDKWLVLSRDANCKAILLCKFFCKCGSLQKRLLKNTLEQGTWGCDFTSIFYPLSL